MVIAKKKRKKKKKQQKKEEEFGEEGVPNPVGGGREREREEREEEEGRGGRHGFEGLCISDFFTDSCKCMFQRLPGAQCPGLQIGRLTFGVCLRARRYSELLVYSNSIHCGV